MASPAGAGRFLGLDFVKGWENVRMTPDSLG